MATREHMSELDVEAARTRRFQLAVLVVLTLLAIGVGAGAALLLGVLRTVQLP